MLRDVFRRAPHALGQAGEVGGAECCCLGDCGPGDGHLELIGLDLQEEVVGSGAAVGAQRADRTAGRVAHGLDDVARLVRHRLQDGAGEVSPARATREAEDRAARVRVPPRAAESGERRDDVDALGVVDRSGQRLGVGGVVDDAEAVAQPLHRGTRDEDRSFERVRERAVGQLPCDRGEQPVDR